MSSVSTEQRKLKVIVENILRADPSTRNDNDRLVMAVYIQIAYEKGIMIQNHSFTTVISCRKSWGLPSYESVTRCRRKLQEADPSLRSDDNVEAMREVREEEYREWATRN